MPAIVVDAGGTHLRLAVANDRGELLHLAREPIANYLRERSDEIWNSITDAVARYCTNVQSITDTGDMLIVAVPGPVAEHKRLLVAPTIAGHGQTVPDLYGMLAVKTNRRIHLLNDVSAAAWYVCERTPYDRFVLVTVSSGIGSKLVDRRYAARVLDDDPFAGEIGHITVDTAADAPLCDCGGRGHLGAISSGRGTQRLARLHASTNPHDFADSLVHRTFGTQPDEITNEDHLVPAASMGDRWSLDVIARAAEPLAHVLASLIVGSALDRVVIMGGFAQQLGASYRDILDRHLLRLVEGSGFPFPQRSYIEILQHGEEPGLIGAAALFGERYLFTS